MATPFKIALLNVPFNNLYDNTIRFNDRAEQEAYFNVNTLFSDAISVNFKIGTLLTTTFVFRYESTILNRLMCSNYAIIKDTRQDAEFKYLYYFINEITHDVGNQIIVDAELDVMQTYYLDTNFSDCMIYKAHLNRFVPGDTPDKVKFDASIDSKLFTREDVVELGKRLHERTKLNFKVNKSNGPLDTWLKDNVQCWVYCFMKPSADGYTIIGKDGEEQLTIPLPYLYNTNETNINGYTAPYAVVCYPILRTTHAIIIELESDKWYKIDSRGLESFIALNGGESAIYQIKMSTMPPFALSTYHQGTESCNYEIYDNSLVIHSATYSNPFGLTKALMTDATNGYGVFAKWIDPSGENQIGTADLTVDAEFEFTKSEIINSSHDKKYNPKLLSGDYQALRITNGTMYFEYDLQKIGKNSLEFIYNELMAPDITRQYCRYLSDSDTDIYNTETTNNLTGMVAQADNSLPYSINNYEAFLANNKNFFMQRNVEMGADMARASVTSIANFATMNIGAGISGALTSGIDISAKRVQSNLTLDNMKNAPEQIANANGNALFLVGITDLGIYAEHYKALDNELEMANDLMRLYGFNYNRIDNIKNVDNIRHYYNYVKADLENINSDKKISNAIEQKFKSIFSDGIRFWNVTDKMFDYQHENYERWLEDG